METEALVVLFKDSLKRSRVCTKEESSKKLTKWRQMMANICARRNIPKNPSYFLCFSILVSVVQRQVDLFADAATFVFPMLGSSFVFCSNLGKKVSRGKKVGLWNIQFPKGHELRDLVVPLLSRLLVCLAKAILPSLACFQCSSSLNCANTFLQYAVVLLIFSAPQRSTFAPCFLYIIDV